MRVAAAEAVLTVGVGVLAGGGAAVLRAVRIGGSAGRGAGGIAAGAGAGARARAGAGAMLGAADADDAAAAAADGRGTWGLEVDVVAARDCRAASSAAHSSRAAGKRDMSRAPAGVSGPTKCLASHSRRRRCPGHRARCALQPNWSAAIRRSQPGHGQGKKRRFCDGACRASEAGSIAAASVGCPSRAVAPASVSLPASSAG